MKVEILPVIDNDMYHTGRWAVVADGDVLGCRYTVTSCLQWIHTVYDNPRVVIYAVQEKGKDNA